MPTPVPLPTSTTITFAFPWTEMFGIAERLFGAYQVPLAISGGLILVVAVVGFAMVLLKKGLGRG
jgi:hypothetical protein